MKPGGKILLNTKHPWLDDRVVALDGDQLAAEILKLPITNTIMLGALAGIYSGISLESIEEAIRQTMPEKLHRKNIAAVRAAAEEAGKEIHR